MTDGSEGEVSRRARRMRLAALVAGVAALCCAAPASAQISGGDNPAPDSGLLPPSGTASVSGTERVGEQLTGSDNFSGAASTSQGWLRCNAGGTGCSVIPGQSSNTYTLVDADVDRVIKFRVRGVSITGGVHEDDDATGAIDALSPTNGTAPSFTGSARSGQTLVGNRGSWTGTGTITYAYRWQRCTPACADIPGTSAEGLNYTLTAGDVGHKVRLEVTATNAADTTTAFSTQSAQVQAGVSSGGPGAGGPAGGGPGGGSPTTTPGGTTTLRRLSPFPVVAIGGRLIGRRVLVSLLRVSRAPRGSIVTVTCRGRGCPFRRARRKIRRRAGLRIRGLERRLRTGTVITIIVRKGNTIGKYTRLRIRRGAPPARIDRCIRPGAARPSACP